MNMKADITPLQADNKERFEKMQNGVLEILHTLARNVDRIIAEVPEEKDPLEQPLVKRESKTVPGFFRAVIPKPSPFRHARQLKVQCGYALSLCLDKDLLEVEGPALARQLLTHWAEVPALALEEFRNDPAAQGDVADALDKALVKLKGSKMFADAYCGRDGSHLNAQNEKIQSRRMAEEVMDIAAKILPFIQQASMAKRSPAVETGQPSPWAL